MGLNRQLANLPDAITTDTSNNVGIGGSPSGSYKLDVSGTGRFSSSLNLGGYLTGQGTNPGGLGGSRYVLDWVSGSMRLFSYGANTTTNGGFIFNQKRSDGSNSFDAMTIFDSGNITMGTIYDLGSTLNLYSDNLVTKGTLSMRNGTNNTGGYFAIFVNNAGGTAGYISQLTSTTILYNSSSDYRLKEDILPIQNAIDRILKIKPVSYKWKNTENEYGEGFIAHELQEIVPMAVAGQKDDINKDGTIKPQGIDYGKLTPLLVKAIQELNEKLVRNNIN